MVLLVNVCSLQLENRIVGAVFEPTKIIDKLYSESKFSHIVFIAQLQEFLWA